MRRNTKLRWAGEIKKTGGRGLPGLSSEQREVLLAHYLLAHHGGDPVELLQELDRRQGAAPGGGLGGVRAGV